MTSHQDNRSLGELFAELSRETRTLFQQEIHLAKTELRALASQASKGAGLVPGGALIAYGGLLAIIAAIVLGLFALGLPAWASALVGGILVAGAGCALVFYGFSALRSQRLTRNHTVETLKEDVRWLRTQMK